MSLHNLVITLRDKRASPCFVLIDNSKNDGIAHQVKFIHDNPDLSLFNSQRAKTKIGNFTDSSHSISMINHAILKLEMSDFSFCP